MTIEAGAEDSRRTYAVVGSTGKATTCYLLEHLLTALGRSTALYSTVELKVGAERAPVEDAGALDVAALVARAEQAGVDDTILELRWVDLERTDVPHLDVAMLTYLDEGIEGEHRDERLAAAEALLRSADRALVLADDHSGVELAARVPGAITVGTHLRGPDTDWLASVNASRPDHIDFTVTHRSGRSVSTSLRIPTRFSVGYAALALVAVMELGVSGATIPRVLPRGLRPAVPGRVERVADRPRCIVDIASVPQRLERVVTQLRRSTRGRLYVVVGARGDHTPEERRAIGRAAAGADVVVVTDDDHGPADDPAAIRADVLAAAREAGAATVSEVAPRAAAIRGTVALAAPQDTVLVAGRGHLTRLQTGEVRGHLDDREEVRAGIAQRGAAPATS